MDPFRLGSGMGGKRQTSVKSGLSDAALCRLAMSKSGARAAKVVPPAEVYTAAWVRLKCQYGCDGYGQCLTCPPFTPTPDQMREALDCYRRAILIHFSPEAQIKPTVADLEREVFLRGAWKAFALGAGPCYFCKSCILKPGQCLHAHRARPAMEACGIDVYSTARKAGFKIEVVRTRQQCPDYFGLILVD